MNYGNLISAGRSLACISAILVGCSVTPSYTHQPARALIEAETKAGAYATQVETKAGASVKVDAGVNVRDIGVALAGGGTKAASVAMGVLAGISDENRYGDVAAISTVSGGGYAAFFLYSKLLNRKHDSAAGQPDIRDFFADCIPNIYKKVLPEVAISRMCNDSVAMRHYRFQQFVRCRQDVLENDCNEEPNGTDHSEIANAVGLAGATALLALPNFVARTVFDWPLNLSPSRAAYLSGIGTAYGLYPMSGAAATKSHDLVDSCVAGHFLNCDTSTGRALVDRHRLTFAELANFLQSPEGNGIPVWIINATASRSRSIFGWAREGRRDFTQYTLQMSPFTARSGFHGEVANYAMHLDLLDATTASAAFFDANETAFAQPWRMVGALVQHLAAFDWGVDIPNPNVHDGWRVAHSLLPLWPWPWTTRAPVPTFPFPTYFADGGARQLAGSRENQSSVYIRLMDGGNNDNLGAYTLIESGMRHILISDHSQDTKGKMADLCLLHNEVALRMPGKVLVMPGLKDFSAHCLSYLSESECGDEACKALPGITGQQLGEGGYPVREWGQPVVLGCIRDKTDVQANDDCGTKFDTRIYLIKPALDLNAWNHNFIRGGEVTEKACMSHASLANSGSLPSVRRSEEDSLDVCETAAYLALGMRDDRRKDEVEHFPQHSTVGMTFASTGPRFGAYRELARWQTRQALRWTAASDKEFADALARQRQGAMPRKAVH